MRAQGLWPRAFACCAQPVHLSTGCLLLVWTSLSMLPGLILSIGLCRPLLLSLKARSLSMLPACFWPALDAHVHSGAFIHLCVQWRLSGAPLLHAWAD